MAVAREWIRIRSLTASAPAAVEMALDLTPLHARRTRSVRTDESPMNGERRRSFHAALIRAKPADDVNAAARIVRRIFFVVPPHRGVTATRLRYGGAGLLHLCPRRRRGFAVHSEFPTLPLRDVFSAKEKQRFLPFLRVFEERRQRRAGASLGAEAAARVEM